MKATTTLIFIFISLNFLLYSQNAFDSLRYNRAALRYFSANEINDWQQQNSDHYGKLHYYFTESFTAELIDCSECPVDYTNLVNIDLFNIYEIESQRHLSDVTQFSFKGKYIIHLKPVSEMSAVLDGVSPAELITRRAPREFPEWDDSGNIQNDYLEYKERVYKWARDFPEEYRSLTQSNDLLKISINEFKSYSEDRRSAIFLNPGGYLIID